MSPVQREPDPTMRVLVVEDERRLCEMLTCALPDMGFAATGARSAEDALDIMERSPHEIMLLDLRLPGQGGLDFFQIVADRWPDTTVIILTGCGDLDAARRAIHFGVVEFLTKPASLGEIEQALERARSRRIMRAAPSPTAQADATSTSSERTHVPADAEPAQRTLDDLEREHILVALDRHKGNRAAAAAELGISLRTLYYRLAQYQQLGWSDRLDRSS